MCHLEFGTAIFGGNFRTSPGVVALLLWASTKCEIADITDMIEIEFKTIGKGSPVLEAFPPQPPKVPISRQPGLISARFLGPGKWNFRQPRQHDAAKLVKRLHLPFCTRELPTAFRGILVAPLWWSCSGRSRAGSSCNMARIFIK